MSNEPDAPDQPVKKPSRPTMFQRLLRTLADQRIEQAMDEGMFNDLPGQGKPLDLGDDQNTPEDLRLAHRMLKSHGFAPMWIEARKDFDGEQQRLEQWLAAINRRWPTLSEPARLAAQIEYKKKVTDLARMLLNYNLSLPPGADQLPGIRVNEWLARLGKYEL
jgi:hypothetical protein